MVSHLFFYQLTLIALVWLCVMLQWVWPSDSVATCPTTLALPPPRIVMTRGRRCEIDTSSHFCPNPDCAYRGWVGWGNLRANGHPSGSPWRQLLCVVC